MFVATKIASEPQLAEQEEIASLSNLAELDASRWGIRPTDSWIPIQRLLRQLSMYNTSFNESRPFWDDWQTEFSLLQDTND